MPALRTTSQPREAQDAHCRVAREVSWGVCEHRSVSRTGVILTDPDLARTLLELEQIGYLDAQPGLELW